MDIAKFIKSVPKTELHLHIEGTLEPELIFKIADRNGLKLPYLSVDKLREAYSFNNLQEFLDIYYTGANVLLYEQDFYDLTWEYLLRAKEENIVHTEIFFDPQTHTDRGIKFETVINGIYRALKDGEDKLGITFKLIMSYLRHLSEEEGFKTLEQAIPFKDWIDGVGLDSSEVGNPPSKFERLFAKSIEEGFLPVAHAGEEGPADYIWEAIEKLSVVRVDHGNSCLNDKSLVEYLLSKDLALTLCPLSNLSLKVIDSIDQFPLVKLLESKLLITINSDDPAYFGGYINDNYIALAKQFDLSKDQIKELAINSFKGSWLPEVDKTKYISIISDMA